MIDLSVDYYLRFAEDQTGFQLMEKANDVHSVDYCVALINKKDAKEVADFINMVLSPCNPPAK